MQMNKLTPEQKKFRTRLNWFFCALDVGMALDAMHRGQIHMAVLFTCLGLLCGVVAILLGTDK